MEPNIDFEADSQVVANTAPVIELARDMVRRERRIAQLEADLSKEQKELFEIQTVTMPDLMRTCGVKAQQLTSGWTLELKPIFRANLPSRTAIEDADEDKAIELSTRLDTGLRWLTAHKAADIIKNTIKVDLGKGQGKLAKQIMTFIKGLRLSATRSETVHPSTLSKLLKEKVAAGENVPFDTFAIFAGEMAIVQGPKAKKK